MESRKRRPNIGKPIKQNTSGRRAGGRCSTSPRKMMSASPSSRVTLADFRAMQTLLLDTRQQLEDSRDQERKAREELRERPVLPDPASFPPPPPFNPLNPFGPSAGHVSVDVQTDPSSLELELHDELRRMRDTLHRTREELQTSREELQDAKVRRIASCGSPGPCTRSTPAPPRSAHRLSPRCLRGRSRKASCSSA